MPNMQQPTASTETPQKGGVIRFAHTADADHFDPEAQAQRIIRFLNVLSLGQLTLDAGEIDPHLGRVHTLTLLRQGSGWQHQESDE